MWRIGAMGGLMGLDWPSLMIVHGAPETWAEVREYARFYEAGALKGAAEKAARERPDTEERTPDGASQDGDGIAAPDDITEVQHG